MSRHDTIGTEMARARKAKEFAFAWREYAMALEMVINCLTHNDTPPQGIDRAKRRRESALAHLAELGER